MSYVILDLEWNAAYSKRAGRFVNEIIEFGAVRLDDDLNITASFAALVKPKITRRLNGKVKQLTKISLDELKSRFIESGISKIIVYDGNIDNVVGYIHSSEMFRAPKNWHENVKQVPIVPETMSANKLMKLFMQQKKTIAVVVDEFGGTSGIVSLEDLVEEIFGE